jgi:hypothetical protein
MENGYLSWRCYLRGREAVMVKGEAKPPKTWKESLGRGKLDGDHWYHVLAKMFIPAGIYAIFYGSVYLIYGADMASRWAELTVLFLVPPMGTGTIVPIGMSDGFNGLTMALTVTMVDLILSMWICWWFVILHKIPIIGRIFVWMEEKAGKKIEANPTYKRASWWVIFSVLLIPIQGSGGMNMSIIGKLVGLRADLVITAVAAGSFTIAIIVAFMTQVGYTLYQQSPILLVAFIVVTIQALMIIYIGYRKYMMHRWEKELDLAPGEDPA